MESKKARLGNDRAGPWKEKGLSKKIKARKSSFFIFRFLYIRSFEFRIYRNGIVKKSFTYLENQNKEGERKTVLNSFFMWNVTY